MTWQINLNPNRRKAKPRESVMTFTKTNTELDALADRIAANAPAMAIELFDFVREYQQARESGCYSELDEQATWLVEQIEGEN